MQHNIIPIAFAFDNNLTFPASVCISSLLMNACEDTFYDIFILHSQNERLNTELLDKIPASYPNCRIQYRSVGDIFDNAFEIRGITTPAYYRLLIPEIITEYDKVIYSDADIIFRMDLSELYNTDLTAYYLAATKDLGLNLGEDGKKYIAGVSGLTQGQYLQSGFIMLNSEKLRKDDMTARFKKLAKNNYKYQDQDILNIACKDKVLFLPPKYNMTDYSFLYFTKEQKTLEGLFTKEEITEAVHGNIHYNGHKPWKKFSVNFDIWWEYYRKSPVFDEQTYFDFFYGRLNELDQLSLWKRVKILIRYFVYGRAK